MSGRDNGGTSERVRGPSPHRDVGRFFFFFFVLFLFRRGAPQRGGSVGSVAIAKFPRNSSTKRAHSHDGTKVDKWKP